jgi:hypothetical protein
LTWQTMTPPLSLKNCFTADSLALFLKDIFQLCVPATARRLIVKYRKKNFNITL